MSSLHGQIDRCHFLSDENKITSVLVEIQVDLNQYQIDAVLFSFRF